ncbi:hypothetical protein HC891_23130 [Candidatus Gracilibacteria bacterium]|nr:hypothetical protein [Candidatus Gracilibacteria bacterium]
MPNKSWVVNRSRYFGEPRQPAMGHGDALQLGAALFVEHKFYKMFDFAP